MILDDLIKEFESIKRDNSFQKLAIILRDWQKDESDVNDLNETVDKFFGTIWFKNRKDHDLALNLWSEFKDDCIAGIAGIFGLNNDPMMVLIILLRQLLLQPLLHKLFCVL